MTIAKLKVAVIFGGRSPEHEVSLVSGQAIMSHLPPEKYEIIPIGITRQGEWLWKGDPLAELRAQAVNPPEAEVRPKAASIPLDLLRQVDVVFPVLHGPYGEDGTLQGLLELLDVPYVGAGVVGSALGMDKVLAKTVWRQHGIPVVEFVAIMRHDWQSQPETIIHQIEDSFGYPCFVKPANSGSSIGIAKAHHREELVAALSEAAFVDSKLLVERAIDGRELECGVLGNDEPMASPVGEVVPAREFYDYIAKYSDERTLLIMPADLPEEVSAEIRRLAVRAFQALDCSGMARVDCFLEKQTQQIYVNEINTIPGFTAISMYPKLWGLVDISFSELVEELIRLGLERHRQRPDHRLRPAVVEESGG